MLTIQVTELDLVYFPFFFLTLLFLETAPPLSSSAESVLNLVYDNMSHQDMNQNILDIASKLFIFQCNVVLVIFHYFIDIE